MSSLMRLVGPALFPSVIWKSDGDAVYLTFDDGPHPATTPFLLDLLEKKSAQATFFSVGQQAARHPELLRAIAQAGHTIGNHSMTHRVLAFRSEAIQTGEIVGADRIIEEATGASPRWFRPPRGYFDLRLLRIARATGHSVAMWSTDSRDFIRTDPASIVRSVAERVRAGAIVLFHENKKTERRIGFYLPAIIEQLADRGFHFDALPA